MKKRTKEEAAAAMRASRARKKAQQAVTPAGSSPIVAVTPVTPVTPAAPVSCPNCSDLCAESSRLRLELQEARAEISRLRLAQDAQDERPAGKTTASRSTPKNAPTAPGASFFKKSPPSPQEKISDADALRAHVIAVKEEKIRNYSTGRVIGSISPR
jgi:hypothetical protein